MTFFFVLHFMHGSWSHLATARGLADKLGDDPHGRMIRGGIDRLAKTLEATDG